MIGIKKLLNLWFYRFFGGQTCFDLPQVGGGSNLILLYGERCAIQNGSRNCLFQKISLITFFVTQQKLFFGQKRVSHKGPPCGEKTSLSLIWLNFGYMMVNKLTKTFILVLARKNKFHVFTTENSRFFTFSKCCSSELWRRGECWWGEIK